METEKLAKKKCRPCEGKTRPMARTTVSKYLRATRSWQLSKDGKKIYRNYRMKNFMAAVDFINRIAHIAETENHHPNLHLTRYRKLKVELSTHAIGGLSENDFILAVKIDQQPHLLRAG